jgi:hypothetical protein
MTLEELETHRTKLEAERTRIRAEIERYRGTPTGRTSAFTAAKASTAPWKRRVTAEAIDTARRVSEGVAQAATGKECDAHTAQSLPAFAQNRPSWLVQSFSGFSLDVLPPTYGNAPEFVDASPVSISCPVRRMLHELHPRLNLRGSAKNTPRPNPSGRQGQTVPVLIPVRQLCVTSEQPRPHPLRHHCPMRRPFQGRTEPLYLRSPLA